MEQNLPMITKRIWRMVRIVYFMVRKGISKSKLMLNVKYMMTKRGKIASKALGNFMLHLHHHHNQTASDTTTSTASSHLSFINPNDFEFSCSNSPAFPAFHLRKRRGHHQSFDTIEDDMATIKAVKAALEMMSNDLSVEASPALPGFGRTPMVSRQLRVTDSPFPLSDIHNNGDESCHVDKAAEDFINRFYKQLRSQN